MVEQRSPKPWVEVRILSPANQKHLIHRKSGALNLRTLFDQPDLRVGPEFLRSPAKHRFHIVWTR